MNRKIKTIEYRLPDYVAAYLINADPSDLNESELKEIQRFDARENVHFVEVKDDSSFYPSNDLNNVGTHCSTFIAVKNPRINKYLYGWKLSVNYGQGWEYEFFAETNKMYKENKKSYAENCTYPQRWRRAREINPSWEAWQERIKG